MAGSETSAAMLARGIVETLQNRGHRAFLVGGCVRDLLLGREPKDYDVATSARPEEILSLFPDARQVGAHFGVMLVVKDGAQVEVATFRSDHAYFDGRRPVRVEFETDPHRDVLRRDFTVNALLLDPRTGEVQDYTGGRGDLEARQIRAIGDPEVRFAEDHLRMLRGVRFAATLGFEIDNATMDAIRRLHASIRRVSSERIRDELIRILIEGDARRGFELLDESGLLAEILPEVAAMKGVPQPPEFHPEGDVWTHTLGMLGTMRAPAPTLALGVLLHDVGKPPTFRIEGRIRFDGHASVGAEMAEAILTRLRFSTEEIGRVVALVANHLHFIEVRRMRESTLKRFIRQPHFEEHLELHRLDCLGSHGQLDGYEFVRSRMAELSEEALRPPKLLTGEDLIGAGYTPGPSFHQILALVEDAQLESRVRTREDALALVRSLFDPPGGTPKQVCR
ncbi:MAG: CCA tRNA nucleotidyltransferase [Bryobacteraceae bacterium]